MAGNKTGATQIYALCIHTNHSHQSILSCNPIGSIVLVIAHHLWDISIYFHCSTLMEHRGPTAAEEQGLMAEERFAITELKSKLFTRISVHT